MFKFLRRYNKWILAVGGTLLMIVFLIPQAINELSQRAARGSATWATMDGEKISTEERIQAAGEIEAMQRLIAASPPSPANTDDPVRWFLLVHEASRLGLTGGRASDMLPEEQYQALLSLSERPRLADEAFGKQQAVNRMMGFYQGAAKLSDRRIRNYARRMFHQVDARVVVMEADPDKATTPPTEDAITEHFNTYRDIEPGTPTEDGSPAFGYRLPDRFKLEWTYLPAETVRAWHASQPIDGVALFKHWREYQTERGFPAVDPAIEVPDDVRNDYIDELTMQTLDAIAKDIQDMFVASWRSLKVRSGVRELPADWASRRINMEGIGATLQRDYEGLPTPSYQAVGAWMDVSDLSDYDELQSVRTEQFGIQVTTPAQLIAAMREFDAESPIPTQNGVASPVLRNPSDGSVLIFRVTDVDPARPPADVDEVRDAIVQDLRRLEHYESLKAQAGSLEADARSNGVLSVALDRDLELTTGSGISLYMPFLLNFQLAQGGGLAPQPSSVPGVGPHVPTIEKIVDRALALPQDTPLRNASPDQRIFALPVDEKMTVLLVELVAQTPFTEEQLATVTANLQLQALILGEELSETDHPITKAFSLEEMQARNDFELEVIDDEFEDLFAPDATPEPAEPANAESSDS